MGSASFYLAKKHKKTSKKHQKNKKKARFFN
jgi:hypothetical protein